MIKSATSMLKSGPNRKEIRTGRTPLMYAAAAGRPQTLRLLLSSGADVNARDCRGCTALMWACAGRTFGVHGEGSFSSKEQDALRMLMVVYSMEETEDPRSKWKKRQKTDAWLQLRYQALEQARSFQRDLETRYLRRTSTGAAGVSQANKHRVFNAEEAENDSHPLLCQSEVVEILLKEGSNPKTVDEEDYSAEDYCAQGFHDRAFFGTEWLW